MTILSAITLAIISLLILFILTKKRKEPSDYLLIIFNLFFILTTLTDYETVNQSPSGLRVFLHFNVIFWLSTTLLIYSYSLQSGEKKIVLKWWFFTFSVPFFIFSFWDLLLNPAQTPETLQAVIVEPGLIYHIFFKGHKLFIISVLFVLLKKINIYESGLRLSYSALDNISLTWLKNYVVLIIIIYTLHLFFFLLYNFDVITKIEIVYTITGIPIVLGAFYLSYNGIKHYTNTHELSEEEVSIQKRSESAVRSKTSENASIFQKLETLFREEQIYTDPELRIRDVAEEIDIPVHKLSEAINEQFEKPFYDYVAFYRCELLKKKLIDPENACFSILALGIDSGFNSKSSLNRIFKQQTGMTPSKFQKTSLPR